MFLFCLLFAMSLCASVYMCNVLLHWQDIFVGYEMHYLLWD